MKRRLAIVAAIVLVVAAPAAAEDDTAIGHLRALALPRIDGDPPAFHSPAAASAAADYARELAAAARWFRAETGWTGRATLAILDRADWEAVTRLPYPSPHTRLREGLVIIPDTIAGHPGFDRWDRDPVALNTALSFHELGHVIARQTGIWSASPWVNELIANIFLAGYVHAEAPAFAALTSGMPPRFADAARYRTLVDFDDLYFAMGQRDYAWFQFRMAAVAATMVDGADFTALIDGLRREFPESGKDEPLTIAETFVRLERLSAGVTAFAADLQGESTLPRVAVGPCAAGQAASPDRTLLVIDNRSGEPLALDDPAFIRARVTVDVRYRSGLPEAGRAAEIERRVAEALAGGRYAVVVPPGGREVIESAAVGAEWRVRGGGCLVVPAEPARLVWPAGG